MDVAFVDSETYTIEKDLTMNSTYLEIRLSLN